MRTTRPLALLLGAILVSAIWRWGRAPHSHDSECLPAQLGLDDAGIVRCFGPTPLSGGQALSVGLQLDLNRVSAEELVLIGGFGLEAANALVDARPDGGFTSWADVDAVAGIGAHRLALLQRHSFLRRDGGL
jgi:competence protein ComEA